MAFSVHNLLQGMAVGMEKFVTDILQWLASFIVHSMVIYFCIGMDLLMPGSKIWKMMGSLFLLSAIIPAGVVIGIIISAFTFTNHLLIGVMQGLAAGSLLYITCFEVLKEDRLFKYGMSELMGALILSLALVVVMNNGFAAGNDVPNLEIGDGQNEDYGSSGP